MKKLLFTLTLLLLVIGHSFANSQEEVPQATIKQGADFSYPMEDVSLTYWVELDDSASQTYSNLAETPFGKALSDASGVDIEYIHPVRGQEAEQFNLMAVSGDYPDIIDYSIIGNYVGGPEKAIEDGVILDLTDLIPEYAPNLYKYYLENPTAAKLAKTDSGKYYSFPFIRGDAMLSVYFGPVVNTVWLEELGLQYPETIDDWYVMLKAFKEKKGASAPLTFESWMIAGWSGSPFIGAFGVSEDFYIDDNGDIKYGSIEPGYKKFLETFNKWYAEDLLDADYLTVDQAQVAAKLTTGESGATLGFGSSRLGVWLKATENNPAIDFSGTKYPVEVRGTTPMFTQKSSPLNGQDAFISGTTKNVEAAMRLLDFGYSEKGSRLFNFGVEGESYNMVNGYPTYTDLILNNPDNSPAEMLSVYTRAKYNGPMVQAKEYGEQYNFVYEQQAEAISNWTISDIDKYGLPNLTPTSEESQELSVIMSEIKTYRDEMQTKFILGTENIDDYDTYVQNIKDMGIDRAIEIYTAAFERFNNR